MKKIITLVLSVSTTFMFAQKKNITLKHFSGKNSTTHLEGDFSQFIDMDKGDTTHYVSFTFQNSKYSTITDMVSVIITKKTEWEEFLSDLKAASESWSKGESISWDRGSYSLAVPAKGKRAFFQEPNKKGSGYTVLYKKDIDRIIEWSQQFKFPG